MPICPRGHESQAEDWCDFCGFPMTPPPGLAIPGTPPPLGAPTPPPAPPVRPVPPAPPTGRPADPFGSANPFGSGAPATAPSSAPPPPPPTTGPPTQPGHQVTAGMVTCPICRTPQTGRYCEECGYDYELAAPARTHGPADPSGYGYPPPAGRPPQTPPGPLAPPGPPAPPASGTAGGRPSVFERPAGRQPGAFDPGPSFDPPRYEAPPETPYKAQHEAPYEVPYEAPSRPASGQVSGPPSGQASGQVSGPPSGQASAGERSPYRTPSFDPPGGPEPDTFPHPPFDPFESFESFESSPYRPGPGPAAGFPDTDDGYERTGPVYAQPGAPGDEFGTSFRLAAPGAQGSQAAPAAPLRTTWIAVVSADRDYFTDMMSRSGPEAAGLFFPPYCPERRIPLTGRGQLRIGRRSRNRGSVPEIDLSVAPEDPGASHQHALLAEQADGSWVLVDQDSTNGTTVNGSPDPVPPHTAIPLNDGDRIHIGAWTTITLHRS